MEGALEDALGDWELARAMARKRLQWVGSRLASKLVLLGLLSLLPPPRSLARGADCQ